MILSAKFAFKIKVGLAHHQLGAQGSNVYLSFKYWFLITTSY